MKVTIESIGATQSFGDNGFTKREWVGIDNSNPTYPVPIKFECIKDKCALLDDYKVGQLVDVEYNITGNRWTNPQGVEKIFNGFQSWRISGGETAPGPTGTAPAEAEPEWLNTDNAGDKNPPF